MRLTNTHDISLENTIQGIKLAYPALKQVSGIFGFIDRNFNDEHIPLVSGGGAGHDPAHWGFVGSGMLSASITGELFEPPTPEEIITVTKKTTKLKKAFYIVKNFPKDVAAFTQAKVTLEDKGWQIGMVIVRDDVSVDSSFEKRRRGVAGTVLIHKILGYYAQKGSNIDTLEMIGQHLTENLKTIGVAFSGDNFNLKDNEIYYGIGIHGEPGYRKEEFKSSELLARELIAKLRLNFQWYKGDTFVVLINSLGGTTPIENLIFNNDVCSLLALDNINIAFDKVGTFLSSYGINGISLSLLKVKDADWLHALQAPVNVPAW